MIPDRRDLDRLADLAQTLAAAWGARGRASTSVGQERAILRLFGVHGLDAAGRPLAGEVVDRYVGRSPDRLATGVALPFAIALLEYDVGPQQLALDVASGAIDLALEAELLSEPERRSAAEAEARRLATAAIARIDANRTARRELLHLLGEPARPWLGTTLVEPLAGGAAKEALGRLSDGVDLLRVEVPVGRELAQRLLDAGVELPVWPSTGDDGFGDASGFDDERLAGDDEAPTGSQRGLAHLRHALDEVAAGRRGYVRLASAAPALAAPEQSVVAGFERIDVVEADAMAEIVAGSVDPDRAIADHAFAHRLLRRSGGTLLVGAGPLAVAPDLATGVPSDAATRAGRALALQLVGVALAREGGLAPAQVVVGAMPAWLVDEPMPAARAAAEVAIRRAILPDHPLEFDEPATTADRAAAWPFILAAVLPPSPIGAVLMRRPADGSMRAAVLAGRAASNVALQLANAWGERQLEGDAADHAGSVVAAAIRTLEALDGTGWRSVLGDAPGGGQRLQLGGDAVVERTEAFDPLGEALAEAS